MIISTLFWYDVFLAKFRGGVTFQETGEAKKPYDRWYHVLESTVLSVHVNNLFFYFALSHIAY